MIKLARGAREWAQGRAEAGWRCGGPWVSLLSDSRLGDFCDNAVELCLEDGGVLRARVREEHVADHFAHEVVAVLLRAKKGT